MIVILSQIKHIHRKITRRNYTNITKFLEVCMYLLSPIPNFLYFHIEYISSFLINLVVT